MGSGRLEYGLTLRLGESGQVMLESGMAGGICILTLGYGAVGVGLLNGLCGVMQNADTLQVFTQRAGLDSTGMTGLVGGITMKWEYQN